MRVPLRGPLAYPAGFAAGYDANHIANLGGKTRFSSVATNATHISLLAGGRRPGTITGTTSGIFPQGIGTVFAGNTDALQFPGQATAAPAAVSAAAVVIITQDLQSSAFSSATTNAQGMMLFYNAGGAYMVRLGGTNYATSTITLSLNVPYFIAASATPSVAINFIAVRLDTGKILTEVQVPGSDNITSDGTYVVGNWDGLNIGWRGPVFCNYYAEHFLSLAELRQWAQDPWAFWYPASVLGRFMSAQAIIASQQALLLTMGVG